MRTPTAPALLLGLLACSGEPEPTPPLEPTPAPAPAPQQGNIPAGAENTDNPATQLQLARELISRFDDDEDGQLSEAEHSRFGRPEASFQVLDLDASGSLDDAEVLLAIEGTDPGFHTRWR